MNRQLVLAEDFRSHWDRILPGLVEAMKPQRGRIRPEDVYVDLTAKRSLLFTADDGFIIFKKELTEGGEWELLVWWAWSSSDVTTISHYEEQICEIAQIMECRQIAFLDPAVRRGYSRVLPEVWDIQYVRWCRRVP